MAKRNLTKQQLHRIQTIQNEKVARTKKREARVDDVVESGDLGPEVDGLIIAHFGVTVDVEDDNGTRIRCHKRSMIPPLVTGDRVVWRLGKDGTGVVVALHDRRSVLNRPDSRGTLKPVAANIDQIFIVVSPAPETPPNLIDRYLVAAHASDIASVLVFNKRDLITDDHPYADLRREYQALGYDTLSISALQVDGLEPLQKRMANRTSIFVGQSGVGKSSLINVLLPGTESRTAEISVATGKGRHTTTTAVLYHLNTSGYLIDSPGIREFGLWHIDREQLFDGYPELSRLGGCRFRNCQHINEPACRLKEAVETGELLERRYWSYLAIRDSLDEVEMKAGPQ